jgi:hypothetical protein
MPFRFQSRLCVRCGLALAMFAGFAGGCRPSGPPTAPVTGRVSLNQKPLAGVHVSFQPAGGSAASAVAGVGSVGITDEQGRYQLRTIDSDLPGAVIGHHVVRLTAKELREKGKDDASPVRKNPLPPQSLDGSLHFDVPAGGTDQANFDLKF